MEDKYKVKLLNSPINICDKYIQILHTYFNVNINSRKLNNEKYNNFILNKGIETICHVFNNLLLYTNNEEIVYKLTDKSIYYFVEFIEQIYNEKNTYLELSIKEAIAFVYKKILIDIDSSHINNNEKNNIDIIKLITNIINNNFYYNLKNKILTEEIIDLEFWKIKEVYNSLIALEELDGIYFKDNLIIIFELLIYLQQINIYNSDLLIKIIKNIITIRTKLIILNSKKEFDLNKLLNKIYNIEFKEEIYTLNNNDAILNKIIN